MDNATIPPTAGFARDLQALLDRRLASFPAQTSGPYRPSSQFFDLLEGLLADAELLETAALTLKAECNAQPRSLNALPPEVLSHIFTLFAETERPIPPFDLRARRLFETKVDEYGIAEINDDGTSVEVEEPLWLRGRAGTLGWIALSHVCKLWRQLVLSLSELWTRDIGALPGTLHDMLDRSGNTRPLTLRLYGTTFRRQDPDALFWETFATNDGVIAQRVREIHWIEGRIGYLEHASMPRFAYCSFSSLDTLVISAHERFTLPLETIDAPRLRIVDFTNVACLFTSTVLTDLSIRGTGSLGRGRPGWGIYRGDLFNILKAHERTLQHLHLDFETVIGQPLPEETRLEFPTLQSVEYYEGSLDALDTTGLINQISYPSTASTHIHIKPFTSYFTSRETDSLLTALRRLGITAPSGLAIEENHSSASDGATNLILRFYITPDEYKSPLNSSLESYLFGDKIMRLTLHIARVHVRLRNLLEALLASIPTTSVKTLSFESSCALCRQEGVTLLERFPAVQTFHLVDPSDYGNIMHALHQPGPNGPRAPMLERLSLAQRSESHVLSSNMLAQQLRARYGQPNRPGRRIEYARLKDLRVDESVVIADEEGSVEAVARIATLVDSVDWKGRHFGV
ncbi:hypothetical protein PENSPDRAFT_755372 [Peniophora sp. CONT]|nr:hypothetical protein PENSPDRAFT_755372 [Peniophora sp. CONT]